MNYSVNQIDLTDICRTFHPTAAEYVFSTVHGQVHRADYRLAHKISSGKPLLLFSYSVTSDSAIPWTVACQAPVSFTISWNLLKLVSIESVMPSNHLILCCPLLFLLSIFPSIRSFPMSWLFTSGHISQFLANLRKLVSYQVYFPMTMV